MIGNSPLCGVKHDMAVLQGIQQFLRYATSELHFWQFDTLYCWIETTNINIQWYLKLSKTNGYTIGCVYQYDKNENETATECNFMVQGNGTDSINLLFFSTHSSASSASSEELDELLDSFFFLFFFDFLSFLFLLCELF
jgi:hypothetical protein